MKKQKYDNINETKTGVLSRVKKELTLQKIIALIILTAALVLLAVNWKEFKNPLDKDFHFSTEEGTVWIDFKGNCRTQRQFTAVTEELQRVSLSFRNHQRHNAKGTVTISILDSENKPVASVHMDAGKVLSVDETIFDFVGNNDEINSGDVTAKYIDYSNDGIRLKKGGRYLLVIEGTNIESDANFDIRMTGKSEDTSLLEKTDKLCCSMRFYKKDTALFASLLITLLSGIIFCLLPFKSISGKSRVGGHEIDWNLFFSRAIFIATPLICLIIMFLIMGKRRLWIMQSFHSPIAYLNLLIIGLVWALVYMILNRTKWTAIVVTAIWFAFGFANYLLLMFRSTPLTISDFASFGTAMDVVGNYEVYLNEAALSAISLSVFTIGTALSLKGYQGFHWKKRIVVCMAVFACFGFAYHLFFNTDYVRNHGITVGAFRPRNDYMKNGYPLSFVVSFVNSKIQKPDDYSAQALDDIEKKYQSDEAEALPVSEKRPNIIVVMNESLSDLSAVTPIETENDYMPFLHSLDENTIKGNLHVSVFGGSTANSEYEFLTGNSTSFFPLNAVPFNNNVKSGSPSLASSLKSMGYGGLVAFHPGMHDSYNRNNAYPALGFEKHIALEDLDKPELVRSFVSDSYDYKIVEKEYEQYRSDNSDDPFFMFNVTIQNHGNYALKSGVVEDTVHVTDPQFSKNLLMRQYLNLVKISDDALEELINYFSDVKEPTAIIIYGDHQPNLGDDVDKLISERLAAAGIDGAEATDKRYQTPFFIWANYDIDEVDNVDISDNYFSAFLCEKLGLPLTAYDKFRLDLHEQFPVYSAIVREDKDGNFFPASEADDTSEMIQYYNILQYNNIVDINNRREDFFRLR